MLKKSILLAASAMLIFATPASAHRAWLLPSVTVLSDTKQSVTVDAATSTDPFNADHNAMSVDGIKVWAPDGSMGKLENAAKGRYRSTFDVAIDKPGTWRVGSEASSVRGTFKVDGEAWTIGRRRPSAPGAASSGGSVDTVDEIPANATDLDLTESQSRNEFFVTAGAPTDTVFTPTNTGLEMVPVTHPTDLVSNEPGKFRFLLDGKPAAGLKVKIIPGGQRYRDGEQAQDLTTDAEGAITVNWPVAGFYWMNASVSDDKPSAPKATKRRASYTATLEVVAP